MLIATIKQAALGNQQAMLDLIKQFEPLLKKYARKLNYPDAYCDLRLFFLDLVHYLADDKLKYPCDAYIVSYIQKAVEHAYYRILWKQHISTRDLPFASLSEEEMYLAESKLSSGDTYENLILDELKSILTTTEYDVIVKIFFEEWSVIELANEYGISRQSVNQTKQRALKKIRQWYVGDYKNLIS